MTYSPNFYNKPSYTGKRKQLRKDQTKAETVLWHGIRAKKLGYKFRRQFQIGRYIVDFCAPSVRLVVELDGNVHEGREKEDMKRQQSIEEQGFSVLRIKNEQLLEDLDASLHVIHKACMNQKNI